MTKRSVHKFAQLIELSYTPAITMADMSLKLWLVVVDKLLFQGAVNEQNFVTLTLRRITLASWLIDWLTFNCDSLTSLFHRLTQTTRPCTIVGTCATTTGASSCSWQTQAGQIRIGWRSHIINTISIGQRCGLGRCWTNGGIKIILIIY